MPDEGPGVDRNVEAVPHHTRERPSTWGRVAFGLRLVQVRLRFLAVLVAAFAVVGNWDLLRHYWDRLTWTPMSAVEGVSSETEYWCPMCPGVVSDWPGKCGVCNMGLVRRKRGEAVPLPDGILSRMQFSPYRLQLAGVQTSVVSYRPLVRDMVIAGFVDADNLERVCVKVEVFERDLPFLTKGQRVEASCEAFPGRKPFIGTVQSLHSHLNAGTRSLQVWLEINNPKQELRPGMLVMARLEVPAAQIEPFRSMPTDPPAVRPGELRQVFFCPQHPDTLYDHLGRCPEDQNELEARLLEDNQRVQWWCPMHPKVTADKPGCTCQKCKGMVLLPRVLTYNPAGEVLALPESALVDTGSRKVVYLERAPGMFDGVEVEVGPRCGDHYPVIRGLEAGQRVATAGAFLLDAETRLNPNVAAGYFGAADSKKSAVK
jgi:hypothetical protein